MVDAPHARVAEFGGGALGVVGGDGGVLDLGGDVMRRHLAVRVAGGGHFQLGPLFDITFDCEDGASAGNEEAHAQMIAGLLASDGTLPCAWQAAATSSLARTTSGCVNWPGVRMAAAGMAP